MKKLAQSMKWTSLAVLAMVSVVGAPGADAAATAVFCSSLTGTPTANLGAVTATTCTDVLENTSRGTSGFTDYYTGFDGGGWTQVSAFDPNSDSNSTSSLFFDSLRWTAVTSPQNFSSVVTASWLLTIEAQDPANVPAFPRTYDLMLVLVRGTGSSADSLGYLLEDFTYNQLGTAQGSFNASFLASDGVVRGMDVYARAVGSTNPPGVPEPGSMLLLVIAAAAAIGVGKSSVSSRREQRSTVK
jgi:hypothetical protein